MKEIKSTWICENCKYENLAPTKICDTCFTDAPDEAYYKKDELSKLKEQRKQKMKEKIELNRINELKYLDQKLGGALLISQ